MSRILLVLLAGLLAWSAPARAAEDPAQLAARIQKKYASISSFTAGFTQAIRNAASGDTENRSGTIAFKKPTLVRWETVKPEKELLVVGKDAVIACGEGKLPGPHFYAIVRVQGVICRIYVDGAALDAHDACCLDSFLAGRIRS
jgi:hypothetical protein